MQTDEERGELWVTTREPRSLFEVLPAPASHRASAGIRELGSEDESLDAVFEYLVGEGA